VSVVLICTFCPGQTVSATTFTLPGFYFSSKSTPLMND
jgi:hypothetical protein